MEHAADVMPELLKYGAGGIIAFLAIVGLVFVWKRANQVSEELAESNKSRAEDAERRFQEARSIAEKATEGLVNASRSMAALSASFENTNRLNEDRLSALQTMAAHLETIMQELRDLRRGTRP